MKISSLKSLIREAMGSEYHLVTIYKNIQTVPADVSQIFDKYVELLELDKNKMIVEAVDRDGRPKSKHAHLQTNFQEYSLHHSSKMTLALMHVAKYHNEPLHCHLSYYDENVSIETKRISPAEFMSITDLTELGEFGAQIFNTALKSQLIDPNTDGWYVVDPN